MAKAKEKGQWSAGIALEKDTRLFSVPRPRAQGRQEPAQPVAIAEAKATTPAPAPARVGASTLQRAKAKEARITSQEARDGAKPRAKEVGCFGQARNIKMGWLGGSFAILLMLPELLCTCSSIKTGLGSNRLLSKIGAGNCTVDV